MTQKLLVIFCCSFAWCWLALWFKHWRVHDISRKGVAAHSLCACRVWFWVFSLWCCH